MLSNVTDHATFKHWFVKISFQNRLCILSKEPCPVKSIFKNYIAFVNRNLSYEEKLTLNWERELIYCGDTKSTTLSTIYYTLHYVLI